MSEIADFLRARIAERRALAEAASPGPWHSNEEHDEVLAVDGITVAEGFALSGRQLRATVDHMAANDPAAVVADCDTKLALIEWHEERVSIDSQGEDPDDYENVTGSVLGDVLRILAQPFAGHPDHKGEEWTP